MRPSIVVPLPLVFGIVFVGASRERLLRGVGDRGASPGHNTGFIRNTGERAWVFEAFYLRYEALENPLFMACISF